MNPTKYAEHDDPDYDVKTAAGCRAAGEPIFLLRAQDIHAAEAVRAWARSLPAVKRGDPADLMAENALNIAKAMDLWPVKKEPDL